jgi:hypothetical protein
MAADGAAGILVAIEQSGVGQSIRQSVWFYPAANILHVVGLAIFAGCIAMMDMRLLGAFAATRPADVILPARRAAIVALLLMLASGACLFIAEASHIAQNKVFLAKMALVGAGLFVALARHRSLSIYVADAVPHEPIPIGFKTVAAFSLALWLTVAALGRFIAYV